MLNRAILIGRLTRDPELRYTPSGTAVCNFTLAINRKFNREETDFIDIIVWQKAAENAAQYLTKGSLCAVEGRIQVRTYETQEGHKRKAVEIVADDVRFLDSKKSAQSSPPPSQQQADDWSDIGSQIDVGDDIPF
jgi:single-strand DNA-binding protein